MVQINIRRSNLFTKQFASEETGPVSTVKNREPVNSPNSEMLPLQIAGQGLLQELNPLIVMYYRRGAAKHWQTQQFREKSLDI